MGLLQFSRRAVSFVLGHQPVTNLGQGLVTWISQFNQSDDRLGH